MSYPSPPSDQRMLKGVGEHWLSMRSFLAYIWPSHDLRSKVSVVLTLMFMLVAELLGGAVPIFYKWLTDNLTSFEAGTAENVIFIVVLLLMGIGTMRILQTVSREVGSLLFKHVQVEATRTLAVEVFGHLHHLSMRFHINRRTGGLSRSIERGIRSIEFFFTFILLNTLPLFFQLCVSLTMMAIYLGGMVSFVVFITLILYGFFTFWVSEWRMDQRRKMNHLDTEANAQAVDSLLNFETVRYFNNEGFEVNRFDRSMHAYNEAQMSVMRSLSLLNIGQTAILSIALVLLLWIVVSNILTGEGKVGDFVMLNMYLVTVFAQLGFLGTVYRQIRQSLTDMEELFALKREHIEIQDKKDAQDLSLLRGEITFEDVGFSYDEGRRILEQLNFKIEGRSKVAVVGPSGSGKTTLSRLLLRFYDIQKGSLKVDGTDVRDVTQTSLRQLIGIVPQDTVLFNGSIADNIGYGKPGSSRDEIEKAAEAAQLGALWASLPEGLDTIVGERGLKLSGGERQRVAIARILLRNPPIVIFDEATASLDTATEKAIMDSLNHLAEGRTTLMIAHRLATIVDADRILVLEKGKIVEEGSHSELIQKQGLYAGMWQAQQSIEELERLKQEFSR